MSKDHNDGPVQISHHLGYGFEPSSKIDLFNPRASKDANQEVVAFLKWLDETDGRGQPSGGSFVS